LHAVSKVGVIFICADVLEGKDRNAPLGWHRYNGSLVKDSARVTGEEKPRKKQSYNADDRRK
jgi:hypothetical protein